MALPAAKQKDILLTGASGVIGAAIARRLAGAGYGLHLTARDLNKLGSLRAELEKQSAPVSLYTLDLSKTTDPERLLAQFFDKAQNPYGLVCNAGNLGVLGQFMDVPIEEWLQGVQENFVAQVRLLHAFAKGLRSRTISDGCIVALSGAGLGGNGGFEHFTSYSTSKAALTHLVEALAPELAKAHIRINAISPGQVSSGLTETAIRAGVERAGSYAVTAQKCKESGGVSPDLAAELVEFLFSSAAAGITGRLLSARFDRQIVKDKASEIGKNPNLFRLRRIDDALFRATS